MGIALPASSSFGGVPGLGGSGCVLSIDTAGEWRRLLTGYRFGEVEVREWPPRRFRYPSPWSLRLSGGHDMILIRGFSAIALLGYLALLLLVSRNLRRAEVRSFAMLLPADDCLAGGANGVSFTADPASALFCDTVVIGVAAVSGFFTPSLRGTSCEFAHGLVGFLG